MDGINLLADASNLLPAKYGLLALYAMIGAFCAAFTPAPGVRVARELINRMLGGAIAAFGVGALMMSHFVVDGPTGTTGPTESQVYLMIAAAVGAGFAGPAGVIMVLKAKGIIPPNTGDKP